MHTRYKIAATAFAASFIFIGVWRGLAVQSPAIVHGDCNPRDPLSECALVPQIGIPAGDLVFAEPELATAGIGDGTLAVIRFAAKAEAADITEFLVANKVTVVDGPKNGGMYTIRLPGAGNTNGDLVKRMQAQSTIVDFIASVQ